MSKAYGYFVFGVFIVTGVFALWYSATHNTSVLQGACTEEAKICPDGSAVGRVGPSCEFTPCPEITNEKPGLIKVTAPLAESIVTSPLELIGEARGYWYFEASFPVAIYDAYGTELGIVPAQAQGEWMTEEFVPFKAKLTFATSTTETGYVVFKKDNPSGLPEHDDELRIPVRFGETTQGRTINLYYYNPELDKDETGNIMCSRDGLVAVSRVIPLTKTPVQDAVKMLLEGALLPDESARGVTTEFPLEGVSLAGVSMKGDTLTLKFNDSLNKTTGGACRAGILWAQIEATAKQFPGLKEVKFSPEDLFQP